MTIEHLVRTIRRLLGGGPRGSGATTDNERVARGLLTGFFSDPPPEHDPRRRRDPGEPRF